MSDTPQTDKRAGVIDGFSNPHGGRTFVDSDFARDLERELALYKKEFTAHVDACEFMRHDKTLGLLVGDRLVVGGVKALRKQRDRYRAALQHVADEAGCCGLNTSALIAEKALEEQP